MEFTNIMQLSEQVYVIGNAEQEINTTHPITLISDLSLLPNDEAIICISCLDHNQQDEVLKEMHRNYGAWCWKVFVLNESGVSTHLSDGSFIDIDLDKIWQEHSEKLALIEYQPTDRLLAWLWLDSSRRLLPFKNVYSSTVYSYPIYGLYYKDDDSYYGYINSEAKNHYLAVDTFVDRIRLCPSCHSGHLNYTETCPECHSQNIKQVSSLHCFTCGHIDPQSHFMMQGSLKCPNCLTQLRHIGVDYDRPLETHSCCDCNLSFSEAVVRSHCLSCDDKHEITDLITRRLYQYRVGDNTQHLMLYGKRFSANILQQNGLVDIEYFINILAWMNRIALTSNQQHMLLALNVRDSEQFGKKYGEARLTALSEELSKQLDYLQNDTELYCQYRKDIICVFLPMTNEQAFADIQNKTVSICESIEYEDISIEVAYWMVPDEKLAGDVTLWLAEKLSVFDND